MRPTRETGFAAALLGQVLSRLPGLARAVEAHGHEPLEGYMAGLRSPLLAASPSALPALDSFDSLVEHARRRAARLLGPGPAQALAETIWERPAALTASHHGLDSHPQSVQAAAVFGLPRARAVPVLACGMVPLSSFSYPRGLMLASADQALFRLPLFPASMRSTLVHAAGPLTADMAGRGLARLGRLVREGLVPAPEAGALRAFLEQDCLDPAVLGLSRYADQAVALQARLYRRMLPQSPPVICLELEDLAQDLLDQDLAQGDSLARAICLDPALRRAVLESLDQVQGCWDLAGLEAAAPARALDNKALAGSGTALFWGIDAKGRRMPMACLEPGGRAVLAGRSPAPGGGAEVPGARLEVPLEAGSLRRALSQGRLAPGLFLSYAVVGFARSLRCCGGVFQTDYLRAMRQGLAQALAATGASGEARAVAARAVDNFAAGPEFVFVRQGRDLRPAGPLEMAAAGGLWAEALAGAGRLTLEGSLEAGLLDLVREFVPQDERPQGWRDQVAARIMELDGTVVL